MQVRVVAEEVGSRVDVFVAGHDATISRSHVQRLIERGWVQVDGKNTKSAHRLQLGELVSWCRPEPEPLAAQPEHLPLDIVFEDEHLLVVNKARGMVVHPAVGHYQGTLVNALLHHCQDLGSINDVLRPGIVHRLDKDTTGLLVVGKNDRAMRSLMEQIKQREVVRKYLALVWGVVKQQAGEIAAPIGRHPVHRKRMAVLTEGKGRTAITRYRVCERFAGHTLVGAQLLTGRTHQIRVHLSYLGYPLVGDVVYGGRRSDLGLPGQALHAHYLGFAHPHTGEFCEFSSALPQDFAEIVERLRHE